MVSARLFLTEAVAWAAAGLPEADYLFMMLPSLSGACLPPGLCYLHFRRACGSRTMTLPPNSF